MSQVWVSPALLLRSADKGDDDKAITLLTPEHGRVPALAKHARGSKRRFGAALQPFCLFEAALRSKSGGLSFLESAQTQEFPLGNAPLLEDLEAGWLFLELADQFCSQGQSQLAFFELVLGGLRRLGRAAEPRDAVRLSVLWGALALEGWAPDLDRCARCGSLPPWKAVLLSPLSGGCLCPACARPGEGSPLAGQALAAWAAAAQGRPISAVPLGAEAALLRWAEHQIGRPLLSAASSLSQGMP